MASLTQTVVRAEEFGTCDVVDLHMRTEILILFTIHRQPIILVLLLLLLLLLLLILLV
jgi:hypothetical protein